jgi:hypothetical protein
MSGRAAIVEQDPRIATWLEEAALMTHYHFCPEDAEQRAFLLELLPEGDEE